MSRSQQLVQQSIAPEPAPAPSPTDAEEAQPEAESHVLAWVEQGLELLAEGDLEAAGELISRAVEADPTDPAALYAHGCLCMERSNFAGAVRFLRQALHAEPGFVQAWISLGDAQVLMRRWKQAVHSYRQATALDPDSAETFHSLAIALQQLGDAQEAEAAYRRVLQIEPDHMPALYGLGLLLLDADRAAEAVEPLQELIERPDAGSDAWYRLATCRLMLGRYEDAKADARKALDLDPMNGQAVELLGMALERTGCLNDAVAQFELAVRLLPDNKSAHLRLAVGRISQGNLDEAIEGLRTWRRFYRRDCLVHRRSGTEAIAAGQMDAAVLSFMDAVACDPCDSNAYDGLAYAFSRLERYFEAETCCRRALQLAPESAELMGSLGVVLAVQGRRDEAIAQFQAALAVDPVNQAALSNLATCLAGARRFAEALEIAARRMELTPDGLDALALLASVQQEMLHPDAEHNLLRVIEIDENNVECLNNLGVLYCRTNRQPEALPRFEQVLKLDPDNELANFNRGLALLRQSWSEEGLRGYEHRMRLKDFAKRPYLVPMWDGKPIPGKTLLVAPEQGLGDVVQFVRFLPLLKERSGARIVLECQEPLFELFRDVEGCDSLIRRKDMFRPPDCEFDAYLPLLSAPLRLGLTQERDIPAHTPYLSVDPARASTWRERLAGCSGLKIGLRWSGNSEFPHNARRSSTLADLAPLAQIPGVTFVSLQQERVREEEVPEGLRLLDFSEYLTTFAETAALISNLDLVVTTCTSTAHVAGAIGAHMLLTLGWDADWRWMADRDDTPWYPSARLFRQPELNDWKTVYTQVAREIETLFSIRSKAPAGATRQSAAAAGTTRQSAAAAGADSVRDLADPGAGSARELAGMPDKSRNGPWDEAPVIRALQRIDEGDVPDAIAELGGSPGLHSIDHLTCMRRGVSAMSDNRASEAAGWFARAAAIEPADPGSCRALGIACIQLGRVDSAVKCFRHAVELDPHRSDILSNLGAALCQLGRAEEALRCFERAVDLDGSDLDLRHGLLSAALLATDWQRALSICDWLLSHEPENARTVTHRAFALYKLKRFEDASAEYERAIDLSPEHVPAYQGLAAQYRLLNRPADAARVCAVALEQEADKDARSYTYHQFHTALLAAGDFESGWKAYETWRDISGFKVRPFAQPKWDGSAIPGRTLLVYADHGFGDAVQFLRFYPEAARRSQARVLLECQPELLPVVEATFREAGCRPDKLLVRESLDKVPDEQFDFQVGLMSLCGLFGIGPNALPGRGGYLNAPEPAVARWRERLSSLPGIRIGICWAGDPTNLYNELRECRLDHFAALAQDTDVTFVSLQVGYGSEQIACAPAEMRIVDLSHDLVDFGETAGVMRSLDLVITVETSVAHLAGALDVRAWTILPVGAPWMWPRPEPATPWYPGMRLFWQQEAGDWPGVFEAMRQELRRFRRDRP